MLVYKSAFDIYHCMYRILRLVRSCPYQVVDYDRARIFDYFYSFPYRAQSIRFVRNSCFAKSDFNISENKYFLIQDDKQLFFELNSVVDSAVRCLGAYGELDIKQLKHGRLKLGNNNINVLACTDNAFEFGKVRNRLLELFSTSFYHLPMNGKNGLKARTGLMVTKYDV